MSMETSGKRDFNDGVAFHELPDGGMVEGRVGDEDVILIRRADAVFAVGAYCTHYHGSLADGLLVADTVRCPLHHACFSLRTGRALRAPALDAIACWRVERIGDAVFVREKLPEARADDRPASSPAESPPRSVIIVGGGGAGLAAANGLRREGYEGALTLISADDSPPCDRPNLSKDFLAGTAPDAWIPLRPPGFYAERRIELILNSKVVSLDAHERRVTLESGRQFQSDALLLATGAEPVHLDIPGATAGQVCYLRSFADSRAIVAKLSAAKSVVVLGRAS